MFPGLPKDENQSDPLLKISGTTAILSTLFTVVGQPNNPDELEKVVSVLVNLFFLLGFQEVLFLHHIYMLQPHHE